MSVLSLDLHRDVFSQTGLVPIHITSELPNIQLYTQNWLIATLETGRNVFSLSPERVMRREVEPGSFIITWNVPITNIYHSFILTKVFFKITKLAKELKWLCFVLIYLYTLVCTKKEFFQSLIVSFCLQRLLTAACYQICQSVCRTSEF